MKRSCGACYRPYRGSARAAILVGGSSTRRALVCARCALGALLVVVETGALELELSEQLELDRKAVELELDRKAVAAAKRRERRARARAPQGDEVPQ